MKKQENNFVVSFENVTKTYRISKGKYGLLSETISDGLELILARKKTGRNLIAALKNVSFKIKKGEVIGIIGRNGAGKTTILKLISNITYPDKGLVNVYGKIGAFIELGAGLHHELTGRENIYLYGAILGMARKQINEKFDKIVDFAEIQKFLDTPIKKYSSGMYSRLGFSVCAFCDPDILLVDEVLAVGDVNFQKKCLVKMHSFAREKTVVFVSHNLDAIKQICTRVIYIKSGKISSWGAPNSVIKTYLRDQKLSSPSLDA